MTMGRVMMVRRVRTSRSRSGESLYRAGGGNRYGLSTPCGPRPGISRIRIDYNGLPSAGGRR